MRRGAYWAPAGRSIVDLAGFPSGAIPAGRGSFTAAMDLELGPRYEELRREVREFLAARRDDAPSSAVGAEVPMERRLAWQRTLVEAGFVGRTVPVEYGGHGAAPDLVEGIVIEQEFAAARVSLGMQNQGIGMLVPTLLRFGSEQQKRELIGPTLRGELIWCQGYSEPGSGSDLASLSTRGELRGDRWIVNGLKIWTSTARQADRMFALVRTEPDAGKHAGISYLLIDMSSPGIEVRPLVTMTGDASFNEVFFTDVEVPVTNVVGRPGQGWEVGTTTLRHERALLGRPHQSEELFASAVAIVRRNGLLDEPVWRDRLIALEARLVAMKANGLRALTAQLEGRDPGLSRLIIKLEGCQLNYDVCGLALDALRERGLSRPGGEHEEVGAWQYQRMYALGLIIGGGSAQIQKNIIAESGLGMPREPKVAT
ncbi:MAG TPA: acyl-CoA dehydrogenase family protein [Thermoanaerobaculia bacterium]|nr:acyl-CoA dehydrogenase family protein [Thermoanaerobaculia bacterium]